MIDFGFGVKLTTIEKTRLETLRAWRNERAIWKWCRQYDLIGEESQEAWYRYISEDPTISMYGILSSEGFLVGICGLTDIDHLNQRAEFSCYVGTEYWKQGLGKKALKTLFSHGFFNLNLNCIWGESYENNPAREMFKALGMKETGYRRDHYFRDGVFENAYLYSILRDEWSPTT